MRIACLGGGPGGLLAALLAKRSDPDREVTVFERNRPGDTFGFGVVFSDATLEGIHAADPVLRRTLADHGAHWDEIEVWLRGERWQFGGNGMAAVTRKTLLSLLQQRATEAGVDIRFATPAEPGDLLQAGYDLVIAADGANSAMRDRFADVFCPSVAAASAKFIWFGTTYPFGGLTFVHEQGPHGVFAVHAYPIGGGVSTFLVEADEPSWRAAGLDAFDPGQPPGPSDEASRAYLEKLFAEQIGGCPLLVNNSRWANFRTWRAARWRHRAGPTAIALLGDAAHTAHFSVGSGTKMAMEDAVALVAALDQHASGSRPDRDAVDAALATYEAVRRPQVTRIQDAARPSLSWWEHFGRSYQALPPWQFAYHFFSRSLPESKLRQRDPSFVEAVHEKWRTAHGGATDPLHSPIDIAGRLQPDRMIPVTREAAQLAVGPLPLLPSPPLPGASGPPGQHPPWGQWISAPDTEADLDQASEEVARGLADGACLVAVGDGTSLTRRLVCEAARLGRGAVTMLIEPADGADAEDVARTVVLSGRADLVGPPRDGDGASVSRLAPLFTPQGIAVVGASRDPHKLGAVMLRSLQAFTGPVTGINPRDPDPAAGRFSSVAAAAEATGARLDLAVLCVPASASARALTEAARGGARAALVCSGGYAEAGSAGAGFQRDLAAAAAEAGVALLGPNTSGFLVPARRMHASFVPGAASVPAGPVAVVAASGGVNHALAYLLAEAGLGVSLAVGLGNAVDVSTRDVLRYLADDEPTRAVALHVESVPDGPALVSAVRYLAARKPVAALVVGRSDVADFAQSHTGALATSWRVTRAALRQAGAVLVDDELELADAVAALSALRLPPAALPTVGVVSAQAGPALLHVDGLRARGILVPELTAATQQRLAGLLPPLTYQANPVDTGRPGPAFAEVLGTVAADPGIGLVSVYALTEPDALDLPAAVAGLNACSPDDGPRALVAAIGGPPGEVTAQRAALRNLGVPVLASPRALTTAVTALVHDAVAQGRAHPDAGLSRPPAVLTAALAAGPLDEDQAKSVLGALGIATPPRRVCTTRRQAHAALVELPGPVAVKLLDPAIVHKSDAGGVFLGVRDSAELDQALDGLEAAGHDRFLVESMAPPGVDLLAGASRDPVFGPVVALGLGGVVAEALADVAVALAPLTAAEAAELPAGLAGRALLDGFRGGPVADRAALGDVLARLGGLLASCPGVEDIEINPLRVTSNGLIALDAVLRTRKEAAHGVTDR